MYLKRTGLKINPDTRKLEGQDKDVIYTNFSMAPKRVRVVALKRATDQNPVQQVVYADTEWPGGKETVPRAEFEKKFTEALSA